MPLKSEPLVAHHYYLQYKRESPTLKLPYVTNICLFKPPHMSMFSLSRAMAVVYSGAVANQYDVNNAQPLGVLPGSLAEPMDVYHNFAFMKYTQIL
jgi:hypothetical protein